MFQSQFRFENESNILMSETTKKVRFLLVLVFLFLLSSVGVSVRALHVFVVC